MLLGVMKAPIQKFVSTLAAAPSKLVRTVVAAVRDQSKARRFNGRAYPHLVLNSI